jgi:hypothetical protein
MGERESSPGEAGGRAETISGKAENAKAGAVLVADDGRELYVEGLSAWGRESIGKRVTLTGIVQRKGIYPEARADADGQEQQGMVGTPLVLRLTEPFEGAG